MWGFYCLKDMKVKFVEKHPIGIKKGTIAEMPEVHAQRMINEGYALPLSEIKNTIKKGKKKAKK